MQQMAEKRNPGWRAGASQGAVIGGLPCNDSELAAQYRRRLSAFRLSAGALKCDAERLVWIAYEISKHAEIAGLQRLSDEAAQIALRACDASEVLA